MRKHVLANGVSGSAVPVLTDALLWRHGHDVFVQFRIEQTPRELQVAVEGLGLVLDKNDNLPETGIDAVAQRKIDDTVFSAERDRRLGAFECQRLKAVASPSCQDDRQDVLQSGHVASTKG